MTQPPEQRHCVLSTDALGGFETRLEQLVALFYSLENFSLEIVPVALTMDKIIAKAKEMGIKIEGIHGPVNGSSANDFVERLKILAYSIAMADLSSVLSAAEKLADLKYLVFHQDSLEKKKWVKQLTNFLNKNPQLILLVENVHTTGSFKKTLDKIDKFPETAQVGVMFDLVHFLVEMLRKYYDKKIIHGIDDYRQDISPIEFDQIWTKMIQVIRQTIPKLKRVGYHIPIGNNYDSLPWNLISDKHLEQLAKLISECEDQGKLVTVTFENQHNETQLRLSDKSLEKIRPVKDQKIEALRTTGVL